MINAGIEFGLYCLVAAAVMFAALKGPDWIVHPSRPWNSSRNRRTGRRRK